MSTARWHANFRGDCRAVKFLQNMLSICGRVEAAMLLRASWTVSGITAQPEVARAVCLQVHTDLSIQPCSWAGHNA